MGVFKDSKLNDNGLKMIQNKLWELLKESNYPKIWAILKNREQLKTGDLSIQSNGEQVTKMGSTFVFCSHFMSYIVPFVQNPKGCFHVNENPSLTWCMHALANYIEVTWMKHESLGNLRCSAEKHIDIMVYYILIYKVLNTLEARSSKIKHN
jgi:hypothetical protein